MNDTTPVFKTAEERDAYMATIEQVAKSREEAANGQTYSVAEAAEKLGIDLTETGDDSEMSANPDVEEEVEEAEATAAGLTTPVEAEVKEEKKVVAKAKKAK